MATKYKAIAIQTRYWKPGVDYIQDIIEAITSIVHDGDFVTLSDKAISTANGNIVDEGKVKPTISSKLIAKYWMKIMWPKILAPLCHLRKKTITYLKSYPYQEGSLHKQLALERVGLLQALMHGSEGGIDGSNLPFSYVSLPLLNAPIIAKYLRERIKIGTGKKVIVAIVDTDKTYSFKNFHFTPRPNPLSGIHSYGGILAYLFGRFFKLKKRATPIAISGAQLSTEEVLEIAKIANRTRKAGAGKTVWDMATTFNVDLTKVTWKMLCSIKHHPLVIIRKKDK